MKTTAKRIVVTMACRGLLPAVVACWLIRNGGLTHA